MLGSGNLSHRSHQNAAFKFATWEKTVSFGVLTGTANIIDNQREISKGHFHELIVSSQVLRPAEQHKGQTCLCTGDLQIYTQLWEHLIKAEYKPTIM